MDLSEIMTLVAVFVVPWLTFRYAQTKDRRDWARQQRALVYVDLLTEASADLDTLEYQLANAASSEPPVPFEDHRSPGLERRRLGARVAVHASLEVRRLWDELSRHGFWATAEQGQASRAALVEAKVTLAKLTSQITNETEPEHGYRPWWRKRPVPVLPR